MPYGTGDVKLEQYAKDAIDAAIAVHTAIGPGLQEDLYQEALCLELDARGIPYECPKHFEVFYKGGRVGWGKIDILIGGVLVLEIKAVSQIIEAHRSQVIHYLKACKLKLGLILNFHGATMAGGIKRVVN